jgi:hypothetical protein
MSFESHLDDPLLREIYAYWRGKRGARRMPARRDIDPAEVPQLLPHLLISAVIDGGDRFRYRLAGTAITRAIGRDPTGKLIDDLISGSYCEHITGLHRTVCRERAALFAESEAEMGERDKHFFAKRLLLPLSDDGAQVNQILSLVLFHFTAGRPAKTVLDGAATAASAAS